jgi:hypothetical protein
MVTIEQLSVQFDVEGEGQDAVFARLFDRHIEVWNRQQRELRERERIAAAARRLDSQPMDEE